MASSTSFFKQSGTSATLQTTFNQTVADAQAAQAAAEDARDLANQYKTAAENARDTANTHAGNAQSDAGSASTSASTAGDHEADALKIASTVHNTQYTLSDSSTGYSALHYATESSNSATTASGHATTALGHSNTASGHSDTAQDWAVKVDGIVDSTEYSSKAWAIGGTGVTSTAGAGPAKDWATLTGSSVDGTEMSAKEYAVGTYTSTNGSAKQWALGGGSSFDVYTTVSGGLYSARYYAEQAASRFDQFDDIYLGSKTSDPSTDNDGQGLHSGDLYFNSVDSVLKVYDGTNWNNATIDPTNYATNGFAVAMAIAL